MSNPKYDVLIKSGPKDYQKLRHVINSIKYLNPQPNKIFLINPDGFRPDKTDYDEKLNIIRDSDVFPGCDRNKLKYRKNWIYAMFIAMFQNVTEQDYYLDIQADNFFVNPIELFTDGKPAFFISPQHNHHNPAYWKYSNIMFGLNNSLYNNESFIIDFMMYNKNITRELLKDYSNFNDFFDASCNIINKELYPADLEIYGNWCTKHHPDMYNIKRNIQTILNGKLYPENYSDEDIEFILQNSDFKDIASISLHTWGDDDFIENNGYR